jgi:hypothetical protein
MDENTTAIKEKKAHILVNTRDEDEGVFLVSMAGPHASPLRKSQIAQPRDSIA